MNLLFRAVVMGFGLAAGAAIFKRVSEDLGLDKDRKKSDPPPMPTPPMDAATR